LFSPVSGAWSEGPPVQPLKPDGEGGGLANCDGLIQYNIITGNEGDDWGGGLDDCHGTIQCNVISGNDGEGLSDCHGTIRNNVITGNRWAGLEQCDGLIENNTIAGNGAPPRAATGGLWDCNGIIRNCIVWGNVSLEGKQLEQCSEPSYSCIEGWTDGGTNIDADPSFVAAGYWDDNDTPDQWWDDFWVQGDYNLRPDSPCIDTGDNSGLDPPGLDVEENLRIAFGRSSLTVDMGAYEFNSAPFTITQMGLPEGGVRLVWNSQPNNTYVLLSCSDLAIGRWANVVTVPSSGAFTWWQTSAELGTQKFFKIELK
jgi:hypothetical protein